MPNRTLPTYFEVWIGRLRCVIELNVPRVGSTFRFETAEYPRQPHADTHLIRKHFMRRGRWYVSHRLSNKEQDAIAAVVNQAHAFIHKLILANSTMAHLAVNSHIQDGTASNVDG